MHITRDFYFQYIRYYKLFPVQFVLSDRFVIYTYVHIFQYREM